jgi:2-polyprenyl-3-methyl-5-hydroxy-6-metoxy-1,4-benzoquinol methylase
MRQSLIDRESMERLFLVAGAVRAGVVDALAAEEAAAAGAVAAHAGTHERATLIVLEALVGEGLVERRGPLPDPPSRPVESGAAPGTKAAEGETTTYRLTPLARKHLIDPGPDLERWSLLHQARKARGWLDLADVIATGEPSPRDPVTRDVRTMVSAMGERDPDIVDEVVDRCLAYAGQVQSMIDVGGAVGHVARAFARCGVRATLFDRPEVIPLAREFLGEEGMEIAKLEGDFTEGLPAGPYDLAYFGNVYHIYGPATNLRITREAFSMVSPGGTIAIQDYVWGRSRRAAVFAVNMLQATLDGGVWSEHQLREWLSAAGFAKIEIFDLETTGTQLVLARRPL